VLLWPVVTPPPPKKRKRKKSSPGKGVGGRRLRCGPRLWPRRSGPLGSLEPGARPQRGGGGGCARALAVCQPLSRGKQENNNPEGTQSMDKSVLGPGRRPGYAVNVARAAYCAYRPFGLRTQASSALLFLFNVTRCCEAQRVYLSCRAARPQAGAGRIGDGKGLGADGRAAGRQAAGS
jgi:hypothetical protein